MDITPLVSAELRLIQSCQSGWVRIKGDVHALPLLVKPDAVLSPESVGDDMTALADHELVRALSGEIDVLLIGAGDVFGVLPPAQRAKFSNLGFVVDVMDTKSACRTYNVLATEGRRVAAFLIG